MTEQMREQVVDEIFRRASESIEVPTPPYDGVADRAREQRRRRWRTVAGSAAAGLLLVGAATWVSTRSDGSTSPTTEIVVARNPVSTMWYDGRLHLRSVVVDLPGVSSLAAVGSSAAYIDTHGNVGIVDPSGARTVVGKGVPNATIVGSGENGWAAWLEPAGDSSRLVVWSLPEGRELASTVVSPETHLVAIDQDRVYAEGEAGPFLWWPMMAEPVQLGGPPLADVASATQVLQRRRHVEMVQPIFNVSFVRRGEGGIVSPGGLYVISREPAPWVPGTPYTPIVYDARTGEVLPSGVARDERVVDAAFGDDREVTYLVADVRDLAGTDLDGARSRLLVLRSCQLEAGTCHDVAPVRSAADRAMFATS